MNIHVDQKFKSQLWPLDPVEFASLEQSILEEGCREKLVVWSEGNVLVDGHNRYEICVANGIGFDVDFRDFESREAVEDWIDKNQAARRNCTPEQYRIITGRIYNRRKKSEHDGGRGKPRTGDQIDPHLDKTADRVASELGVSAPTIKRNGQRAEVYDSMLASGDDDAAEAAKSVPQKVIAEAKANPEKAAETLKRAHVANNSGEQDWYTPVNFLDAARAVMGRIDLDPASSDFANQFVKAKTYFTKQDDGLQQNWNGNIWLNPPYASGLVDKFAEKLVESLPNIKSAIVLVNNATETRWFHLLANYCECICFPRGRIKFLDASGEPKQSPLQGQVIFYFGKNKDLFCQRFSEIGSVWNSKWSTAA